jgi:hypothetical protein
MKLILFSIIFSSIISAKAYTELDLKPIHINNHKFSSMQLGRTYNYQDQSRILAAKEASFPILEQYESLLFPQKNFRKEKAKQRLERIEVAVHGNIQKGSIQYRLNLLEDEITAWQIANYQTLQILDTKKQNSNAFSYSNFDKTQTSTSIKQRNTKSINHQQRAYKSQNKAVDNDYQNYRMMNPIVRDIGRRSVRALFE